MKSFICKLICTITFNSVCLGWCKECKKETCVNTKKKK